MPNCNSVTLMGNVTRDPDLRYTPSGTAVCDLSLAINRVTKNDDGSKNEETTFVDVTLWSRLAEIASQYLHKGDPVFIQGRLHLDTWDDKQTGKKRSRLKVIGENLQLIGGRPAARPASPADRQTPAAAAPAPQPSTPARQAPPRDPDLDVDPDDQDIPF